MDKPIDTLSGAAVAGLSCACPRCGKGKLFAGFITLRPRCDVCGLDYGFADSGDGPAVFIMFLAGFIVVAAALITEVLYQPPYWVHAALWLPLIAIVTLGPLRPMKGLMIALQYFHKAAEGRLHGREVLNAAEQAGEPRVRRRTWLGLLIPAVLLFAALVALGTWQLQRKTWKEQLIATLAERLAAPPAALPAPSAWPRLEPADDEYRRVTFSAQFETGKDALVLATASAFRPDVSGLGFWVFTPARLEDGSVVVVNRGFVPTKLRDSPAHYDDPIAGTVDITGVMRWPETRLWFTPRDDPAHNTWYVRDPATIAAAKNWGAVAPFYIEQESPVPPGGWPQPGKIVVNLPNNHLQYVVTWYGLALVLVVVFIVWALKSSREAGRDGRERPPGGTARSL